ncbi:MAG TPA: class I SAM-dependent methyltransferase [Puia sp.]|nr:class I SAM-dependent methyltransferase [Puia sp.]
MAASVSSFAGSVPEKYDRYLGPVLFEPYAKDIVSYIDPAKMDTVLEIACGTGRVTRYLRHLLPPAVHLVATDLNQDMLAIAKKANEGKPVEWYIADAQDLHFADRSFSMVVCQFGFMFMPDKPKAFAEAYRVLQPTGSLLFNTWDSIENNEVFYLANNIVKSYFPDNPPVFYQVTFSMHDEKEIRSLLEAAGFRNIEINPVKKDLISPTAKEMAIGIVEGNPVYGFICERDPSLVDTIRNQVEKEIASKFGEKPLRARMQAWVGRAWK